MNINHLPILQSVQYCTRIWYVASNELQSTNTKETSEFLVYIYTLCVCLCAMEYTITSKTVTVSGERKPVSNGKCSDCLGLRCK